MSGQPDIVIIGSGMGGLAAAKQGAAFAMQGVLDRLDPGGATLH